MSLADGFSGTFPLSAGTLKAITGETDELHLYLQVKQGQETAGLHWPVVFVSVFTGLVFALVS